MSRRSQLAHLAIFAVVLFGIIACQAPPQTPAPAPPDFATELGPHVEKLLEVWNNKSYDALDGLLAQGFVRRAPDQDADGLEGMKAFMRQAHEAYPDFRIVANGRAFGKDVAFLQWNVTGTYTAEGAPPASVDIGGATMLRFADGKIAEEHVFFDTATLLAQTGAASVPHAAAK